MSLDAFEAITREQLIQQATPLNAMPALSAYCGQKLWIKRDDLNGIGIGGNKVRKLEYLLADAKAQSAKTLVTGGGLQSNHAVTTAVCAKRLGFDCHLALVDAVPITSDCYQGQANQVVDRIAGATIHHFASGKSSAEAIKQIVKLVEQEQGETPYEICMGGSDAIGALGYVRGALEMANQFDAQQISPDYILHASGSAGTQAGLIIGFKLLNLNIKVIGCSVLHPEPMLRFMVNKLCQQMATMLKLPEQDFDSDIHIRDYSGTGGYGIPGEGTWQAIDKALADEGIILDPCYTGKAFEGLLALTDSGELSGEGVFLHTGGMTGLFAYADSLPRKR